MIPASNNLPIWWSLMQHYGAPTRLLDWTHSPFVAAYFACESHPDRPGAVWVAHANTVNTFMERRLTLRDALQGGAFGEEYPPRVVYMTHRLTRVTDRMLAQQMSFSLSTEVLADHEPLRLEAFGDPAQFGANALIFMVGIIPAERKLGFLFRLRAMNITAQSLFPGIDGLGRSVAELVRLNAHQLVRQRAHSSSPHRAVTGPLQFPTAVRGRARADRPKGRVVLGHRMPKLRRANLGGARRRPTAYELASLLRFKAGHRLPSVQSSLALRGRHGAASVSGATHAAWENPMGVPSTGSERRAEARVHL
jgi:hypothetical protein